jgi:hypothetical protein
MDFIPTEPSDDYAICIHTCVEGGCKNRTRSTIWTKHGNPLRKHASYAAKHPRCTSSCPGYQSLNQTRGTYPFSRPITKDDCQRHLAGFDNANIVSSNIPSSSSSSMERNIRSDSPYSHQSSIINLNNKEELGDPHAPTHSAKPCFKIIYIPDPTRVATPIHAQADLAFLKTSITSLEYQSMKHLLGSIHVSGHAQNDKRVVYMQEWVCNSIHSYKDKELMINSSVLWFDYCVQHMEQMDPIFSLSTLWIGIHFVMQWSIRMEIEIHGAA